VGSDFRHLDSENSPGIAGHWAAVSSIGVLLSAIPVDDDGLEFAEWVQTLAAYTLMAGVLSVSPVDIGPDVLRQWISFLQKDGVPSDQHVYLHRIAMTRLSGAFREYAECLTTCAQCLWSHSFDFILNRFKASPSSEYTSLEKMLRQMPQVMIFHS
jgi:hypothetical protein